MYNYSCIVNYLELEEDKQNVAYRNSFLKAFNIETYTDDIIFKTIDNIYEKVKDNDKMIEILNLYKKYVYRYPIEIDNKMLFTFMFSFEAFQYMHECLGMILTNKPISDDIFNKFVKSFKNNNN